MRIISQDGKFDCSYEHIALGIISENLKVLDAESKIIAYPIPQTRDDDYYYMAKYSTEEKAKQAMEMLHDTYRLNQYALSIVSGTAILKGLSENERINAEYLFSAAKASCIFRFPADEEV